MGSVKMYRNSSLPSPGTMAADQVRYVKVGSSYIQYVIDNSGVAIPPAVMAHTHNIADTTGLQAALDGKSDTSHTHATATITVAGFMSAADKSKLDGLSNYTHPSSGVTPGTYRSVTVDAMGHVTAGTNPTTLLGYGITQKYVSLDPADGFATPVQSSYDLNTAALTAYGYATTATNRPTGAAANGYFSTNAIDSTSFFQTFANPTVQDAYFYRRRNTSTNYAWLQVASREWVATQISGTTGRIGKFTGANTIGDSLLSESGIGIIANGGVFVSDVPHNSNIRGFSLWASGLNRWVFGKAGTESGSDSGSDYVMWCYNDAGAFLREPMRISRATGNVTFSGTLTVSGGNSTQWNAAVPSTRTLTINGTTFDLSANRSWTISAGIGGSATVGRLPKMATTTTIADSLLSESGISIIANGGVFVSDTPTNTNVRGFSILNGGVTRWTFGKAGTESGSDSGSDFTLWSYSDAGSFVREPMRISRSNGFVTFTATVSAASFAVGANTSAQWTQAFSWGNHATFGYATVSYVDTNTYSRSYLDSEIGIRAYAGISITGQYSLTGGGTLEAHRQITLLNDQHSPGTNRYYGTDGSGAKGWFSLPSSGGISGSGTANIIPRWNGSTSLTDSALLQALGSVYVGGAGDRYNLIVSGSIMARPMTASEISSYTPPALGCMVYQTDGTEGLYMYKASGWQYVG
ncbi:hypothetical protein [Dyadobacter fermentans]|uniref:hypothetical protein n=1 Tax=Dyadobacter fermentans TaxID=94254 RepID=UPI001CBBCC18|nr:hypothetical protein [Dyadobacter fermentans]MBZ1362131.1 hypothetical protein [Dyadobacter fermentans]